MKLNYCACIIFGSLSLLASSCTESHKNHATTNQEQQLSENQIIKIMMTVDEGEIDAAEEALEKKLNPSVEAYAKYLIQQHQKNLDELKQLTKQLDVDLKESVISDTLKKESEQENDKLEDLPDNEFNSAFISAMIKDHQNGLKLIDSKLAPQTKNPQLKIAVEKFRNMVADHLEKAREIQKTN